MKTKVLKVKTVGSREEGNLRPEIADHLPQGVNLSALEYGEGYAIVKLSWSDHPLVEKPQQHEIDAIEGEEVTHPDAEKAKVTCYVDASVVDGKPEKPKTLRKEKMRGEDVYVVDES